MIVEIETETTSIFFFAVVAVSSSFFFLLSLVPKDLGLKSYSSLSIIDNLSYRYIVSFQPLWLKDDECLPAYVVTNLNQLRTRHKWTQIGIMDVYSIEGSSTAAADVRIHIDYLSLSLSLSF